MPTETYHGNPITIGESVYAASMKQSYPAKSGDKPSEPLVANFCQFVGWLTLIAGAALIALGFTSTTFTQSIFGLALFCSAVFWFGLGRIIKLLAQIAHNTQSK